MTTTTTRQLETTASLKKSLTFLPVGDSPESCSFYSPSIPATKCADVQLTFHQHRELRIASVASIRNQLNINTWLHISALSESEMPQSRSDCAVIAFHLA
ncbi:hypothetical protein [Mangrovibacterium marinum]|uniref:hypothetical protein n=1 Tax=Mangrovibacterium marinum TaxID=1639118 RepID=UPI0011B23FB9|nr:hypothetical protein [Mangrovibacterium marinum]